MPQRAWMRATRIAPAAQPHLHSPPWRSHTFTCFADALAFRGRSPCVTKSATHLLVFIVLFPTLAVLFLVFRVIRGLQNPPLISGAK